MEITIRHSPAFSIARCQLVGGEVLKVQPDAMVAHSPGMELSARVDGGVMRGLKRKMLGGESFFVTTYTAPPQGGFVDVAPYLFGDMLTLPVPNGHALILSRSGWVASGPDVDIDARWGGFKNMFGGEGGFVVRATGQGDVILGCLGALDLFELGAGERLILDSNHMVAYDETVTYNLRRAVEGRSIQSVKTGEGFVFEFTGPGRVYGQTRSPQSFLTWLKGALTLSNESPTGQTGIMGGLGSLLDN
jgi:uncharacterized protein (TIGR00266 family)